MKKRENEQWVRKIVGPYTISRLNIPSLSPDVLIIGEFHHQLEELQSVNEKFNAQDIQLSNDGKTVVRVSDDNNQVKTIARFMYDVATNTRHETDVFLEFSYQIRRAQRDNVDIEEWNDYGETNLTFMDKLFSSIETFNVYHIDYRSPGGKYKGTRWVSPFEVLRAMSITKRDIVQRILQSDAKMWFHVIFRSENFLNDRRRIIDPILLGVARDRRKDDEFLQGLIDDYLLWTGSESFPRQMARENAPDTYESVINTYFQLYDYDTESNLITVPEMDIPGLCRLITSRQNAVKLIYVGGLHAAIWVNFCTRFFSNARVETSISSVLDTINDVEELEEAKYVSIISDEFSEYLTSLFTVKSTEKRTRLNCFICLNTTQSMCSCCKKPLCSERCLNCLHKQ